MLASALSSRGGRIRGRLSAVEARTAKAVMVFRVLGLICAGMNARMKFGTLQGSTRGVAINPDPPSARLSAENPEVGRGYGRGYVERSKDCRMRARQSMSHSGREAPHVRLREQHPAREAVGEASTKKGRAPEFHPGPKGKSHANTVRMMGDCADSSSSLRALSC